MKTLILTIYHWDKKPIKCKCKDCGKVFNKGDEGDNERYCLECDIRSRVENEDFVDFDKEYSL